jgi:hypothetical protein
MLGLRKRNELRARSKKGSPHQTTIGLASANSIHATRSALTAWASGVAMWAMAIVNRGTPNQSDTFNRRLMSWSSGFPGAAADTLRGSSAIPQIGQLPGSSRTTSGCIGQTYSVLVVGSSIVSGSNAMPQTGQMPGPSCLTSGSIGQR